MPAARQPRRGPALLIGSGFTALRGGGRNASAGPERNIARNALTVLQVGLATNFKAARVLPSGINRTLRLTLYDIGDASESPRLALHATELGFRHPATEAELHWTMSLPADMQRLLLSRRGLHPMWFGGARRGAGLDVRAAGPLGAAGLRDVTVAVRRAAQAST